MAGGIVRESDEDRVVILPPPSAKNPIPSLPAALRIDNKERCLEVLLENPTLSGGGSGGNGGGLEGGETTPSSFRQLLVFGKDSLRTLLLRQVLQDPHARTWGKASKKSKTSKNWDEAKTFPLPKILQPNVVGTKILLAETTPGKNAGSLGPARRRTVWRGRGHDLETNNDASNTAADDGDGDDADFFRGPDDLFQHVDVVTYILRPWDLDQTVAAIARIKNSRLPTASGVGVGGGGGGRTHKQHHRIVYVPTVTAMCAKILSDHEIWDGTAKSSVSVVSLQLDLFPLGSDLLSLELGDGLREAGSVGGTPSDMLGTTARALSKLQDVVGPIPRIQSLGPWGEDALAKLLDATVDDHWAAQRGVVDDYRQTGGGGNGAEDPTWEDAAAADELGDDGMDVDQNPHYERVSDEKNPGIAMVLLDRRLDMVTPMVTPLTYEGLLDELVGIESGHVVLPETVINPADPGDDDAESNRDAPSSGNPFDDGPSGSGSTTNPFEDSDSKPKAPQKLAALGVHEGDTLFAEVRDQHVEVFGSFLQNQAVALKESHANFTSKETKKDLDEIQKFVQQIPIFTQSLRSLTNHIHLAELIKATTEDSSFRDQWNTERAMIEGEYCYDFLEECIFGDHPPYKVLRLICLQSLASGGLKANKYDQIKQHIVQVYGYEFLPILHDLETMGWIKKMEGNLASNFVMEQSSRSLFQKLKRNLVLIHAEVNTVRPDDVSYASSGYAPLTVRLIQSAMQGWTTSDKEDILKDLFQMVGPQNAASGSTAPRLLDVEQSHPPRDLPTTLRHQGIQRSRHRSPYSSPNHRSLGAAAAAASKNAKNKPTLIAVYLGGITYLEIAALRFLSKRDTFPYHIVVVTTRILNGSKLLRTMGA